MTLIDTYGYVEGRRLAEWTINTDLQLALAVRVPMWFSYNPEESGGKRCCQK